MAIRLGGGVIRKPELRRTKDGATTYRVRFRIGTSPRTGKPLQTSETFDSFRDADAFCRDLDDTRDPVLALRRLRQRDDARAAAVVTLDVVAEQYFTHKATRVRSDRTVADYRRDYRNWIAPALGRSPISFIDEADVQRLVDSMSARLSPKSVADRHAILFGIFKYAVAPSRNLAAHNPCIGTDLPPRRKTQAKGLRPAEWQALEPALRAIDTDAADLALFLLSTGWRWSEATAVDAFDVEDDGIRVHVNMGRVVRRNAAGQHVIVEDAKSDAGLRRVELDHEVAGMVRERLGSRTSGLVFTTGRGHQWHYANFLNRCWKPAVAAANLTRNPTPHWLRHTHVVWMATDGNTSLAELQRRIGHESISTTLNVYGRMIEDVSPQALEGFAAMRNRGLSAAARAGRIESGEQPH